MNPYLGRNRTIDQYRWYGLGDVPVMTEVDAASNTLLVFGGIVLIGLFIWGMKQ